MSTHNRIPACKRTKSRNGCITCKKKRLKCDESKPLCLRCQKAGFTCEGYKNREYQWRIFARAALEPTTSSSNITSASARFPKAITPKRGADTIIREKESGSTGRDKNDGNGTDVITDAFSTTSLLSSSDPYTPLTSRSSQTWSNPGLTRFPRAKTSNNSRPSSDNDAAYSDSIFPSHQHVLHDFSDLMFPDGYSANILSEAQIGPVSTTLSNCGDASPFFSRSNDPLFSDAQPDAGSNHELPSFRGDAAVLSPKSSETGVDDIWGPFDTGETGETLAPTALSCSHILGHEPDDSPCQVNITSNQHSPDLIRRSSNSNIDTMQLIPGPLLGADSPELLLKRYDKYTCGILSLKDGPAENPWRTLILPICHNSLSLHHAVFSLAAVHGSYDDPSLLAYSIEARHKSIRYLITEMENLHLTSAIGTSIILAFSDSWEHPVEAMKKHLKGARAMVRCAITEGHMDHEAGQPVSPDVVTLRYLCNAFVYMEALVRLTDPEDGTDMLPDQVLAATNQIRGPLLEVDPLLGCASALFPIIYRTGNLIQKIRAVKVTTLSQLSEAIELQDQLLNWEPADATMFEALEDSDTKVQHSIQTAEALRLAVLLYLHQAAPEIPSAPSEVLARQVLVKLASVAATSRTLNLQIFSLLAAGCEVTSKEDREWVERRWRVMFNRMQLRSVDKCWRIVKTVWDRRDAHEAEKLLREQHRHSMRGVKETSIMPQNDLEGEQSNGMDPEYTIRGRLHWFSVMEDGYGRVFLG